MLALYWGMDTTLVLTGLGVMLLLAAILGVQAHRERVRGGNEELPGMTGEVTHATDERGFGYAHVRSEIWRVHCTHALSVGDMIRVQAARGLTLDVVRIDDAPSVKTKGAT